MEDKVLLCDLYWQSQGREKVASRHDLSETVRARGMRWPPGVTVHLSVCQGETFPFLLFTICHRPTSLKFNLLFWYIGWCIIHECLSSENGVSTVFCLDNLSSIHVNNFVDHVFLVSLWCHFIDNMRSSDHVMLNFREWGFGHPMIHGYERQDFCFSWDIQRGKHLDLALRALRDLHPDKGGFTFLGAGEMWYSVWGLAKCSSHCESPGDSGYEYA